RLRVAEAEHRSAEQLSLEAARVQDRADVPDRRVIGYDDVAGLGIDFHFREPDDVGLRLAVARIGVLRHRHQPLADQVLRRHLGEVVDVLRQLVAVVLAAELDRFLRGFGERHAAAGPADLAAGDLVRGGVAALRLRGNLLQLLNRVGGGRVRRARHRVRGLAAGRDAGPRQVLARVSEDDVALLERHADHVGGDAVHVEHRVCAEVADAGLNLQAAVAFDDVQTVDSDRATGIRADRDADAARLVALLARRGERRLALLPLEHVAALVERFPDERAGHVRLPAVGQRRTERRVAGGRVDLAQLDLIDAEFLRGLREDRLHDADALRPARRALRRLWRRVGQHREAAPPHRLGLIRE